jgi:glyoxylase I family protein
MGRIQHLAIASQEPEKLADFYKSAFGWQEVRRLDNPRCHGVVLSDGAINISVLKFKQDQIGRGLEFTGLHHFRRGSSGLPNASTPREAKYIARA